MRAAVDTLLLSAGTIHTRHLRGPSSASTTACRRRRLARPCCPRGAYGDLRECPSRSTARATAAGCRPSGCHCTKRVQALDAARVEVDALQVRVARLTVSPVVLSSPKPIA